MQRTRALDHLRSGETFDLLIIGGGATGLGTAVEAATRGWRVALVERGDFAQGTSSRSTKLVHGGVRYLKQGNISLVREALRERGHLLRNAPHLAHDMAFVIPSYSQWNRFFYGVGLKAYDWLAGSLSLGPSRMISREEVIRRLPTVETQGLVGGVIYHDGQFDDARMAITLARTATNHGAIVANYCACVALVKTNGRVAGALVRDLESGEEFTVHAKCVVNATGVFVDDIRHMDTPEATRLVAASQGIHLVLPREFLPGDSALMVPKTADGRVLFAVPWKNHVIVGTTDTPVDGIATEPRALAEERDFVMDHARKYLAKDPAADDVLSVYAGLRPLVKHGDPSNTAALSRDHTIVLGESRLITVTGGKWTTYRKMAEDVADRAAKVAGLPDVASRTTHLGLHGWVERPAAHPYSEYGAEAESIARLASERAELASPVHERLSCTRAEVVWHARHEMARTVEDVLARRTRSLVLDAKASIEASSAVAKLLAEELGRDESWERAQVESYTKLARRYVFTDPESLEPR